MRYIDIEGMIRPPKDMSPLDFIAWLDENGFQFLGNAKWSDITDEDYE